MLEHEIRRIIDLIINLINVLGYSSLIIINLINEL